MIPSCTITDRIDHVDHKNRGSPLTRTTRMSIPNETLAVAAIAVHDVLLELKLKHTFFGGYEVILLGSNRTTKDVDLVVPVKNSSKDTEYQQIVGALSVHNDFVIALGNRRDAIRAIHTSTGVGVDIMLQCVSHYINFMFHV